MAVIIRIATKADLPTLDVLLALSYPRLLKADYPPSILVTVLPAISRANPALLAGGTYHIAQAADGTLLAAGGWTARAHGPALRDGRQTGHVRHVVAHPDHLRQGHAGRVMRAVMDQARKAGMARLECLSTRTAVPFYRAVGFATRAQVDVPIGPAGIPFPSVLMDRDL